MRQMARKHFKEGDVTVYVQIATRRRNKRRIGADLRLTISTLGVI